MKNACWILMLSLFFVACQQKIQPTDISKINGYWEIEKVVFEGGSDKEYPMNETFDYFEMNKNNKGFKKKVMPQLDGTFLVNDVQETVVVRFTDGKAFVDYSTPYTKWSEELITLTDDKLVLVNAENKEYHYKKTGPINILGDGKKSK